MRFVKNLADILNNHRKTIDKFVLMVWIFLFVYGVYLLCTNDYSNVLLYINMVLYILIILIWIYLTPKESNIGQEIKSCYPEGLEQYQKFYKGFEGTLHVFFTKDNCREEIYYNRTIVFDYIFKLLWFCSVVYVACTTKAKICGVSLFDNSILSLFTYHLLILSMILNFVSYYFSIMFVLFLRNISKEIGNLCNLPYVQDAPSTTYFIQKVKSIAEKNARIFLSISLTYTFSAIVFILRIIISDEEGVAKGLVLNPWFWGLYVITFALGIGTAIFIYWLPKVYLRRIVDFWKLKTLYMYQNETKKTSKKWNQKELIIMRGIVNDKLIYDSDISNFFLVSLTVLADVFSALAAVVQLIQ